MKIGSLFFFLLLFVRPGHAQDAKSWDSTFRPNGYKLRVDFFRAYPDSEKDIVFLGNSITAGVDWNELLGQKHARNRGISGDITFGLLERLDEITSGKPARVFILIGINDISRNIPDSIILANYEKLISGIQQQSPRTKIFVQTILPVNNTFQPSRNQFNKDEHIAAVNEGLKRLATRYKVTLVDLHPHFLDGEGRLNKALTYDGLHLNPEGYKVWARILKKGDYLD